METRNQVLPCEVTNDMAEHCRLMERKIFDLTMSDVKHLAYLLAVKNLKTNFLRERKDWKEVVKNFLRRNQEISVTTTLKNKGFHS
jgi:hypothetical protein